MILSPEMLFWIIKNILFVLLLLVLITKILFQFGKDKSFSAQKKNLCFFFFVLVFWCLVFLKGNVVEPRTTFFDKNIDYSYIENKIDLYGSDEMDYKKYTVRDDNYNMAYFYKFDNASSFEQSFINYSMQFWNFIEKEKLDDFVFSYSQLERCREPSYLNCYTNAYEGWLLLEKNGEVIVIDYCYKADFKWYDYFIVINEPKIPNNFIYDLLDKTEGDRTNDSSTS